MYTQWTRLCTSSCISVVSLMCNNYILIHSRITLFCIVDICHGLYSLLNQCMCFWLILTLIYKTVYIYMNNYCSITIKIQYFEFKRCFLFNENWFKSDIMAHFGVGLRIEGKGGVQENNEDSGHIGLLSNQTGWMRIFVDLLKSRSWTPWPLLTLSGEARNMVTSGL